MKLLIAITVILILLPIPATASLKDIDRDKLPHDASVQQAYADLLQIEDLVRYWSPEWHNPTPKKEVAKRLKSDIDVLKGALRTNQDNVELILLTGLAAHYGYNVDVDNTYELAVDSFKRANTLAASDIRPGWFLANHGCESVEQNIMGMKLFLQLEAEKSPEKLPEGFWDDYMNCATVVGMPAHALRAGVYLQRMHAPPSTRRDFLIKVNQNRFLLPDATKTYEMREIWTSRSNGDSPVFGNPMFGFKFSAKGTWRQELAPVQNATSVVQEGTGPHLGKVGGVIPNILLVSRQPKDKETLEDFVHSFTSDKQLFSIQASHCPVDHCIAYESPMPHAYTEEGGGRAYVVAFERIAPEFPGVAFEEPVPPPTQNIKKNQVNFFRPNQAVRRLPGKLYYLVVLDTANSVLDKALQDYDFFLQNLTVE